MEQTAWAADWVLSFCTHCGPEIVNQLQHSGRCKTITNGCNTWMGNHHDKRTLRTIEVIGRAPTTNNTQGEWRLSNGSRRKVLDTIDKALRRWSSQAQTK